MFCTQLRVHTQERERNKAELSAAIAKHSHKALLIEEELAALQQVRYMPQNVPMPYTLLSYLVAARHASIITCDLCTL